MSKGYEEKDGKFSLDGQKAQPEGRKARETSSTEDSPRPKAPLLLPYLHHLSGVAMTF